MKQLFEKLKKIVLILVLGNPFVPLLTCAQNAPLTFNNSDFRELIVKCGEEFHVKGKEFTRSLNSEAQQAYLHKAGSNGSFLVYSPYPRAVCLFSKSKFSGMFDLDEQTATFAIQVPDAPTTPTMSRDPKSWNFNDPEKQVASAGRNLGTGLSGVNTIIEFEIARGTTQTFETIGNSNTKKTSKVNPNDAACMVALKACLNRINSTYPSASCIEAKKMMETNENTFPPSVKIPQSMKITTVNHGKEVQLSSKYCDGKLNGASVATVASQEKIPGCEGDFTCSDFNLNISSQPVSLKEKSELALRKLHFNVSCHLKQSQSCQSVSLQQCLDDETVSENNSPAFDIINSEINDSSAKEAK